jgi:hypothetical protein
MVVISLPAGSKTLQELCKVMKEQGMAKPRAAAELHMSLGNVEDLLFLPTFFKVLPPGQLPMKGGGESPLPAPVLSDVLSFGWTTLTVAKKASGGTAPVETREVADIYGMELKHLDLLCYCELRDHIACGYIT